MDDIRTSKSCRRADARQRNFFENLRTIFLWNAKQDKQALFWILVTFDEILYGSTCFMAFLANSSAQNCQS